MGVGDGGPGKDEVAYRRAGCEHDRRRRGGAAQVELLGLSAAVGGGAEGYEGKGSEVRE